MSDSSNTKTAINLSYVIVVIGLLNGLMPFATDLYLPAFSQIAYGLNTSIGSVVMTMSSFFLGSCIGQLCSGPILDKYGRKFPMIGGLILFSVTSAWCAMVQYFEVLVVMRFFQAMGISMCNVGSKAVVRDVFPAKDTARVFSILGLIMGISPIIAPTVGSWLLIAFGWRSIFYFLTIFSFFLILLLWNFLPDTVSRDSHYSLSLSNVGSKYWSIMKHRQYLGYSFVTAMCSAVLFSWITSSSFIFIELLQLSEMQFGLVFAATSACLMLSNQTNILLLKKYKSQDIAIFAVCMELLISAYLFYVVLSHFNITMMIIGMCLLMFFLHMITTNTMALGLNQIDKDLGVASAFMGSLRMALSAFVTVLIGYFLKDSAIPMVVAIALISAISLTLQLYIRRTNNQLIT